MTIAPGERPGSSAAPVVRPAGASDLLAINAIYNHYVLTSTASYQNEVDSASDRERWFAAHGPEHPVIVAECDGVVIGWAALSRYHPRAAYAHTVEDSVYIHPDHHRRGIGRTLVLDLLCRARQLGHRSVVALISADQDASLALHRACGFSEAGRLREVGFKFSRWLDVVYMQHLLRDS